MKRILFFTLCIFIFSSSAIAQDFRWLTGGGSINAIDPYSDFDEMVHYMCTDSHGNIYALSIVGDQSIQADTFYVAATHSTGSAGTIGSEINLLLTSYKCDGTMRWARLLEDNGSAVISGLAYDGNGNIYVSGTSDGDDKYIADSLVDTSSEQYAYLARFDTSGNFKWVKYVGVADAYDYGTGSGYAALNTDNASHIHYTMWVKPNVSLTSTFKTQQGDYDLVYDSLGNLLSITKLQVPDSNWVVIEAAINKHTGTIYGTFEDDGDNVDTFLQMVAAYDNSGNQLWADSMNTQSGLEGIIYNSGNLYSAGSAEVGRLGEPTVFKIKNDSATNNSYVYERLDIIVNLDTNGNVKWIYKNESNLGVDGLLDVTQLANGNIAAVGIRAGITKHGTDSLVTPTGIGQIPFINIIDTAGNIVAMKQVLGDGFYNWGVAITSDTANNIYFGGRVEDSLYVPGLPAYHSHGGNTDFFVMKYGYTCNCTATPTASFTYTGTSSISFTYTGTTPTDSVQWNFGDGSTGTGLTPTHTYDSSGTYTVCVTVYTGCGNATICDTVTTIEAVSSMSMMPQVSVYPNPMSNELTIAHAVTGTEVKLYNTIGQQVYLGKTNNSIMMINTNDLSSGNYILQLTAPDGKTGSIMVAK